MTQQPEQASEEQPRRVLFLCTHNSSRSHMAEGLLRARGGSAYAVFSAGTHPTEVHPLAVKVMREIGIDLGDHRSKSLEEFEEQPPMDLVVTVCDEAAEACPFFPRARYQVHWGFPDPSRVTGSEEIRREAYRHIRDLLAVRIARFLGPLEQSVSLQRLYASAKAQEKPSERRNDGVSCSLHCCSRWRTSARRRWSDGVSYFCAPGIVRARKWRKRFFGQSAMERSRS